MNKLERMDDWIGKTLFIPPIIKLCQVTRQTQYAVGKQFALLAALSAFYHANAVIWKVIWGVISAVTMVYALIKADEPGRSEVAWRMIFFAFLVLDILISTLAGSWRGIEFWFLALAYEYANSIKTIPPTELKKTTNRLATTRK